jgi:hypothetical protein
MPWRAIEPLHFCTLDFVLWNRESEYFRDIAISLRVTIDPVLVPVRAA